MHHLHPHVNLLCSRSESPSLFLFGAERARRPSRGTSHQDRRQLRSAARESLSSLLVHRRAPPRAGTRVVSEFSSSGLARFVLLRVGVKPRCRVWPSSRKGFLIFRRKTSIPVARQGEHAMIVGFKSSAPAARRRSRQGTPR